MQAQAAPQELLRRTSELLSCSSGWGRGGRPWKAKRLGDPQEALHTSLGGPAYTFQRVGNDRIGARPDGRSVQGLTSYGKKRTAPQSQPSYRITSYY